VKRQTEPEVRRKLAVRVAAVRRACGWTQKELSDRAGLPRSYIADLEGARRNPSMATLIRLANALGIGIGDLFADQ
jgi:transcriptional regulator with XRE-family HTH domain